MWVCVCVCVSEDQVLSEVQLVYIKNFISPWVVNLLGLNILVCLIIYL